MDYGGFSAAFDPGSGGASTIMQRRIGTLNARCPFGLRRQSVSGDGAFE